MIILIYLLSTVFYFIAHIISGMIIRTVYLIIFNRQSVIYQFIGEFFGIMVGFYIGSLVFTWFDKASNPIVLALIYILMWQLSHMEILPQHYPKAQRIGVVTGILVIIIITFFITN